MESANKWRNREGRTSAECIPRLDRYCCARFRKGHRPLLCRADNGLMSRYCRTCWTPARWKERGETASQVFVQVRASWDSMKSLSSGNHFRPNICPVISRAFDRTIINWTPSSIILDAQHTHIDPAGLHFHIFDRLLLSWESFRKFWIDLEKELELCFFLSRLNTG